MEFGNLKSGFPEWDPLRAPWNWIKIEKWNAITLLTGFLKVINWISAPKLIYEVNIVN